MKKLTIEITPDEQSMIIDALRIFEDQFNGTAPADKEYFSRVLALADRIESNIAWLKTE